MIRRNTLLLLCLCSISLSAQFPNWTKLNYEYEAGNYSPYTKMAVSVSPDDQIYAYVKDKIYPAEYSTDGGNTWTSFTSGYYTLNLIPDDQGGVYRVKYRDKDYPDSVFYSPDKGATWNFVSVSTNRQNNLHYYYKSQGVHYLHRKDNRGTIYVGEGQDGENFKYSDDNGATWNTVVCPTQPFSALLASDGSLYITSYNSGIHVSTDGGNTWDNSGYSGTSTAFDLFEHPLTGEVYVCVAGMSIMKTDDQGQSWTQVATKPNLAPIKQLYISADGMFYLQTSREIFESATGTSYNEVLNYTNTMDFVKDMAVSDQYVYAQVDSSLYRYARQTGSVGAEEFNLNDIQIYPNPSTRVFELRMPHEAEATLFSLDGQKIRNFHASANFRIDLSRQASGTYLLQLRFADGRYAVKRLTKY